MKRVKQSDSLDLGLLHQDFFLYYFYRVLYHIHDMRTWHSFSLTCRDFAKMCEREADERMVEFDVRMSISEWVMKNVTHTASSFQLSPILLRTINVLSPYILPNGRFHYPQIPFMQERGILSSFFNGVGQFYCLPNHFCGSARLFMWKEYLVIYVPGQNISFMDVISSSDRLISGPYCRVCRCFHAFTAQNGNWNREFGHACSAANKKLVPHFPILVWESHRASITRKNRILQRIIEYGKSKKE